MTVDRSRIEALVMRIEGDFLDIPELKLSLAEAQTRFGLDRVTCEAVLAALVDASVLRKAPDGAYVRHFPRVRAA